ANCRWSSRSRPRRCSISAWKAASADLTHTVGRALPAKTPTRRRWPPYGTNTMLKIENLHASINGREILKGLTLDLQPGQVHAIMGPNGAGKSTLGNILAGRDGYEITEGTVEFEGQPVLELDPEERAAAGLFLAFQYP